MCVEDGNVPQRAFARAFVHIQGLKE